MHAAQQQSPVPSSSQAPQPPPERQRLSEVAGTVLSVSSTREMWRLPVDALVVPCYSNADFGGQVAQALAPVYSPVWADAVSEARSRLGTGRLLPGAPLVADLRSQPSLSPELPPVLLAATAYGEDGEAQVAAAARAARALVRTARRHGIQRLACPLLGTGSTGALPRGEVAQAMLAAFASELTTSPLAELILVVPEEREYKDVLALYSRLPQRLANDMAAGDDLLDVAAEVQALTDVLLLRETQPPLAVGILGGWGTGKSFALHLMKRHLAAIRSRPSGSDPWNGGASPYVGHVYPITFDAWTYAKSDLWSSLMQTIFLELSRQVSLEQRIREQVAALREDPEHQDPGDLEERLWAALFELEHDDRATVLDHPDLAACVQRLRGPQGTLDTESGSMLWQAVRSLREEQKQELDRKREQHREAETALETRRGEAQAEVDRKLEEEAYGRAWIALGASVRREVERYVAEHGLERSTGWRALVEFQRLTDPRTGRPPLGARDFLQALARQPWTLAAFAAGVALLVGAAWLLQTDGEFLSWLGGFGGLGGLVLAAGSVLSTLNGLRTRILAAWSELQNRLQSQESRLAEERRRLLQEALNAPDIQALETRRRELAEEIELLERRAGFAVRYPSLAKLLEDRCGGGSYEGALGLMHRVQCDLQELSRALTLPAGHPSHAALREQFPRGPARVVLFIDDLDRCPPDRVVEVLEAAQLLVKTRLFVVVLAMDLRYVTRALERVYREILTSGDGGPSGLDYVEKIVQLPYAVRPVDAESVERFLRGQMQVVEEQEHAAGAGAASGGPAATDEQRHDGDAAHSVPLAREVLLFSTGELAFVADCCRQVQLSPRSIKRVVNAFKLLKIVWSRPTRHLQPSRETSRTFVVLIALSAAYPETMARAFRRLAERLEEGKTVAVRTEVKGLVAHAPAGSQEAEVRARLALVPAKAALAPAHRPSLELVRSLSFVTDLPEPARSGEAA